MLRSISAEIVRCSDELRLTSACRCGEYSPATIAIAHKRHCSSEDTLMKVLVKGLLGAVALAGFSLPAFADTTLTIATVNNGNMIRMQKLTDDFTKANPDIKLNWVTLEENVLRQKVTTDIATKGGQFDVLTIGAYETPIWGKLGWLDSVDDLGDAY